MLLKIDGIDPIPPPVIVVIVDKILFDIVGQLIYGVGQLFRLVVKKNQKDDLGKVIVVPR